MALLKLLILTTVYSWDFLTCPPNCFHLLIYSYLLHLLSFSSSPNYNPTNAKMVQEVLKQNNTSAVTWVITQKITFTNHSNILWQPSLQAEQFKYQHLNHIFKLIFIQDNTIFIFNFILVVKTSPKCKSYSICFQQWSLSHMGAAGTEQRSQLG